MVKIGDRVEMLMGKQWGTSIVFKGERGTIVGINRTSRGNYFAVRLDEYNPNRHPYDRLCKDGHGALVGTYNVKKINISKQSPRRKNNLLV